MNGRKSGSDASAGARKAPFRAPARARPRATEVTEGTETTKEPSSSARATPLYARLASDGDRQALDLLLSALPNDIARLSWIADLSASLDAMPGHRPATAEQLGLALREYAKNGALSNPNSALFDAYLRRATYRDTEPKTAPKTAPRRGGVGQRTFDSARAAIADLRPTPEDEP